MPTHHRIPAFALALLLVSAPALAQTIRGDVVDATTHQPLEGSVVVLVDSAGVTVLSTLTSTDGRFVVHAPGSGRYALRIERIGYGSVTTEPFAVAGDGEVFRHVETSMVPITLDSIEVESGRRCVVRPGEDALETRRVWEQVRTALSATVETQRQRQLRFDTETWTQVLDGRSLAVRSEQRAAKRNTFLIPFGSRPARELVEHGFIQSSDGGRYYDFHAPTADVLLSDEFLDTHCFRLVDGEDETEGMIGLGFEPVRRRDVADIQGTLWLDRRTSALRFAQMRYVARDSDVPTEGALARVEFEPLPGGRWIVSRWFIRMPQLVDERVPLGYTGSGVTRAVGSFNVEGGEVMQIRDVSGQVLTSAARFALAGEVWDSLAGRPLAGATIVIEGTSRGVRVDSNGRFSLAGIAAGRYTLRAEHPRLDSLPPGARPRAEVEIVKDQPAIVKLGVPGLRTVVGAACPGLWTASPGDALPGVPWPAQGVALVSGTIVDPDGKPVPGAIAHISWDVFSVTEVSINVHNIIPSATADEGGRFIVCGVPDDAPLSVWATLGDLTGPVVETRAHGRFAFVATVVK